MIDVIAATDWDKLLDGVADVLENPVTRETLNEMLDNSDTGAELTTDEQTSLARTHAKVWEAYYLAKDSVFTAELRKMIVAFHTAAVGAVSKAQSASSPPTCLRRCLMRVGRVQIGGQEGVGASYQAVCRYVR